jgi:hypothetical protein
MQIPGDESKYGDYIIGYDLDELQAGRTTIFGHPGDFPESGAAVEKLGDSLFGVLHAWLTDVLAIVTAKYELPTNRGAGSISRRYLEKARARVQVIEALQREAAAAGAPSSSNT